ncbi:MAG: DUF1330 domain-containing protein [Pelagimonas sp.]|jgi:uncharacterized protein (DUF1330 family)|nr:DUF1330 domain-containing protein [Pelagimonas sp.]
MPKAYWIANVTVTDPEAYQDYRDLAPPAFAEYGARLLARGVAETLEGRAWQLRVILEFDSLEKARACYNSPVYQAARAKRQDAAEADIALIEALE